MSIKGNILKEISIVMYFLTNYFLILQIGLIAQASEWAFEFDLLKVKRL